MLRRLLVPTFLAVAFAAPQPGPARCMPAITQKVGDSWTAGPGGEMQMGIVKGR